VAGTVPIGRFGGPAGRALPHHPGDRQPGVNPIHTSGEKCGKVRALFKAGITVHRGFDAVDLPIRSIASRYPLLTQSRIRLKRTVYPQKNCSKE
jgi:hypothetical protein